MSGATDFLEKITGLPYWEVDGRRLVRREYVDGPRYAEALRGARKIRERAFRKHVSQALREIDWNYTG